MAWTEYIAPLTSVEVALVLREQDRGLDDIVGLGNKNIKFSSRF